VRKAIEDLLDDENYDDGSYGAQERQWLWLFRFLGQSGLSFVEAVGYLVGV